jgi:DNA polymerase-3 subunit chi
MRIDFYEMSGRFRDPLEVAVVLVGKAWPATGEIAIVGRPEQLQDLDALLWERPPGRFLAHAIDDPAAPIRLLAQAPARASLLINLDPGAELPDGEYQRVLEIVPPDEQARQGLRQRWIDWKSRGAELHHHVLK